MVETGKLCFRRLAILAALCGGAMLAVAVAELTTRCLIGVASLCNTGVASAYSYIFG